ncbi:trypsin-like peptidase domain-containing protein [Flavobacteriaceae bacterium]|jgi:Do/DeqQ family serine protease|nr:trypsin-like peptidase domain-containing protein [Flavobacteriaceae bacterium]MDA9849167.1 trypsin-like peptidase domain-containing protein [Flavobacteriaceae bacterium]MDC0654549.1 trypsin-like peptidase domain-containing protein [Flavobacteriaceae bacterium]
MKKYLLILSSSIIGGIMAIYLYEKIILEDYKEKNINNLVLTEQLPIKNVFNSPSLLQERPDFVEIAENTINSVVHVKNSLSSSDRISLEDLMFGRNQDEMQIGTGSGVIVSADGYIITNAHVIDKAEKILITTNDNKEFEAKLIGSDEQNDIALLKVETKNELPYAIFGDSDATKIGEWVLAIGNPFNLTSTVTAGIISAKARNLDPTGRTTQSFIQTDAAVNPGNSGGALVNTQGQLIGINTAIQSQTGSYIGYSFAVPSNIAKKVIEDLMEFGIVQNGFLGVTGTALNNSIAKEFSTDEIEGFYINSVEKYSGADLAGIKKGDIIKFIDEIKISKFSDLKGYLSTKRPNDLVMVHLVSDNKRKKIKVRLNKNERISFNVIGILKNLSEEELKKYNKSSGVKISDFNKRYEKYWRDYGIEIGNIINSINGVDIKSISDVQNILNDMNNYGPLRIEIINSNGEMERFNFR